MRMETFIRKHYKPAAQKALESQHNSIWVAETASGRVLGFVSITWRQVLRFSASLKRFSSIPNFSAWHSLPTLASCSV